MSNLLTLSEWVAAHARVRPGKVGARDSRRSLSYAQWDELPDAKGGEAVCAVVVQRPGASATVDDLSAWCRERMAGYKRPRAIRFIAESDMPRTATGKIQHRKLRERIVQPT
jgi:acyl-CoA synthetase (AMP-forming)/AMP-acid ligase II